MRGRIGMIAHSRMGRRRITVMLIGLSLVVCVFVIRLVDIQIVRGSELFEQARDAWSGENAIQARRGSIIDARGTVIAESMLRYDITLRRKLGRSRVLARSPFSILSRMPSRRTLNRILPT
jgi:cell division protein FtsI (penicillin-binding protein 3)